MTAKKLTVTIAIPVYKGSKTLRTALDSVVPQLNQYADILIIDDNKPEWKEEIEKTKQIIESYNNSSILLRKNAHNMGCQKTIALLAKRAKGDIILYLAQDDIFSQDAVSSVMSAFQKYPEICLVTRPYFWFETDYKKPVRAVAPKNPKKDTLLSIYDGYADIQAIFGSVGQISGLGYRREFLEPFHSDLFSGHIYPIAEMLKKHPCFLLHRYTVAVGIQTSQTRHIRSIYHSSPTKQWIRMFTKIYTGKQFREIRNRCIRHIATHHAGLVQIKNFGTMRDVLREIHILIRSYPLNLVMPTFWFYAMITIIMPRRILVWMTDTYKRNILAKTVSHTAFQTYAQ